MSCPPRTPAKHRAIGGLLAVATALAACQTQVGPPTEVKKTPRNDGPRLLASPSPGATVKPTGSPAPTGDASPPTGVLPTAVPSNAVVLDLLQKPTGAATLVSGAVRLDAGYIVAAGAGNLVAAGAGNIVAAGGGNILSHNGGQILSHNGGQIVAAGAGNVISQNGGQLVAAGAGNLLSQNGGQLVAAGAGNILSPNGGQIVAAGAGNYRLGAGAYRLGFDVFGLLQAASGAPAAGATTEVAGVEVAMRSLRTGAYLPVGVDAAGKPVYVVYTNLAGRYELYVPEAEQGHVMVEANVLRAKANPRLEYQSISGIGDGIDEDVALVTEVLRRSVAIRLRAMFRRTERAAALDAILGDANARIDFVPGAREALGSAFGQIWDAAHAVGLTGEKDPQVQFTYAYAATDAMLRKFDLDAAMIKPGKYWDGQPERAIPALTQIVKQARVVVAAKMAADPTYVQQQDWFQEVNRRTVAAGRRKAPWEIARPADLGAMIIEEFIVIDPDDETFDFSPPVTAAEDCEGGCQFHLNALASVLDRLGANGLPLQGVGEAGQPVDIAPDGVGEGALRTTKRGYDQVDRLNQAQFEIILQMVLHLLNIPDAEKTEILDVVRSYAKRPGASAAPSSSPSP